MAAREFHLEATWLALAGAVIVMTIGAAGDARADCVADCIASLCAGRGATIVTGHLLFEEGELRVAVETVVRPGSDPTIAAGARISGGYDPDPQAEVGQDALVMISPTAGGPAYSRWFPIGTDGHVRCADPVGNPATGRGSTPADIALANDMEPAACRSSLEAAGYMTVSCPDEKAAACTIGRTKVEPARAAASLALEAAASLLALMLVRRLAPGASDRARRGSASVDQRETSGPSI